MPARDIHHEAVRTALTKAGWNIVADPYRIHYKDIDLYADLAAEKPIAAQKDNEKIVVEVKSFVGRSLMADFHLAVGQYSVYQSLIQKTAPEYDLYLAIDDITYLNFFQREGICFLVKNNEISLLVVDIDSQEIVQWIS